MSKDITKKDLIKSALKASSTAVNDTYQAGGAVTFQSGKKIIRKDAEGNEKVLKELPKAYIKIQKKRFSIA